MTNWHAPEPPIVNEDGSESHPAYGAIRAARITSTPGAVLFDSDIRHQHLVRLTVTRMDRQRDLNRDWLRPGMLPLIEVDMSEAQWASFVSSLNTSGVPCTLRATETQQNVPGLEFAPRLQVSLQETRKAADRAFATIREAMQELESLDGKAGVKARREAMRKLHYAIENAPKNAEFAGQSLAEHAENVVQKARADVEAMVASHADHLGIDSGDLLAIEAGAE